MEVLDNGQVDFLLEVRNDQTLDDEIAQLQMSVDGGAAELVNIIANLPAGESVSFAFARTLAPGPHTIRFSVGDSHTKVSVNVEGDSLAVLTSIPQPRATVTSTIISTQVSANTAVPTNTPTPIPTSETAVSPDLRHLEEKTYMLKLINAEREKAKLDPVVLGDNIAAQLHAEAALENCFASHWGIDGLTPYMRYSLAGGYQSNGENGHGNDYCIKASDGYRAITSIEQAIREAMEGWMNSSGHKRNILGRWHKKVNIGLAWDQYNFRAYQHFEGDYVEYDELPTIEDGMLRVSGRTKNGARFDQDRDLTIQIFYDPPTHSLTRGQVARTYCYDNGLQIAAVREPLTGGARWTTNTYRTTHSSCASPYDVPSNLPGPRSLEEAHRIWKEAYQATDRLRSIIPSLIAKWITATTWTVEEEKFSVQVDVNDLLEKYGSGVYTIMVWGDGFKNVAGSSMKSVVSQYSIFHEVEPPDTYSQ